MKWYEELFNNYAEKYENESYTKGTLGEVDFIEREISSDKTKKILDVGCGTGRHSIELSKRGYSVTGIDLSESMLAKAREKAKAVGVSHKFSRADARDFSFPAQFDLVIMICEGAFPLMETDEMNFKILQNCYNTLKPKGKLIQTTLNALFPLFHSVKDFINSNSTESESKNNTFNLMTFRDYSTFETTDDSGIKMILECNERYYTPSEITWLLKSLGFVTVDIYGCQLGNFSREHKLTTEDFEMLVISEK